jgi:FHS family L-fucose permease-like MFS transporter
MTTNEKRPNYALPIAIMFALFFMIAFVTGYQNPLGDVIKEMTGGNRVLSQLGTLANFIAYLCMGIPAGILLERRGYRMTALMAVVVGFVGVLVTYLSGFINDNNTLAVSIYILGAFIAGFSMCMLNTVVNPMLNSLGKNQNQGNQLVQFGGSCNSLGATLAPVIVGGLLGGTASTISSANPVFFLAMGIFAAAFIVLFFSKLPESPDFGQKKEKIDLAGAFKFRNFTYGFIAIFCYVGVEVGLANWTYQYLSESPIVDPAMATAIAGTVVGMYWLFMLFGRLIGGAIGAKVSSRSMLTATSLIAVILILAGIFTSESAVNFIGFDSKTLSFGVVSVPLNAIFFIACGLCTSVMWGAIYNLSVAGLGKYTAAASGLFMMMVCGGGILPMIQGVIGSSHVLTGFLLPAALCVYLLVYALVLSRPKA